VQLKAVLGAHQDFFVACVTLAMHNPEWIKAVSDVRLRMSF